MQLFGLAIELSDLPLDTLDILAVECNKFDDEKFLNSVRVEEIDPDLTEFSPRRKSPRKNRKSSDDVLFRSYLFNPEEKYPLYETLSSYCKITGGKVFSVVLDVKSKSANGELLVAVVI